MSEIISNRPFKSIEDQLAILKSRGLLITNDDDVCKFLMFKNYYNIINRYGQYYYNPSTQRFNEGTKFDNIVDLYFFDNELKNVFYRKLMKVESQFKSVLAHVFCKNHQDDFAYLNPNNFDKDQITKHISLLSSISNQIKYNSGPKEPANPIKHHMRKYGHVPFWVLVNNLYFNDAIKFYNVMNKSEQNEICNIFFNRYVSEHSVVTQESDILTPEQLSSFLNILNDYRNITAHDNFLFGAKIKTQPKYCSCVFRTFSNRGSKSHRSLYDAFIVMRVFLEFGTYANLHNRLIKLTKGLSKTLSCDDVNRLLDAMGFPKDWYDTPKLK